jgi:hypothetical protein
MAPVGFVVPRVGFLIRPDFLSMRCCLTVRTLSGEALFGIGVSGERRISRKGGAPGFVPSLCPHPSSKPSSTHYTIKAVSFPNSLGEKSVGKVAVAADSGSNKRAARRSAIDRGATWKLGGKKEKKRDQGQPELFCFGITVASWIYSMQTASTLGFAIIKVRYVEYSQSSLVEIHCHSSI